MDDLSIDGDEQILLSENICDNELIETAKYKELENCNKNAVYKDVPYFSLPNCGLWGGGGGGVSNWKF